MPSAAEGFCESGDVVIIIGAEGNLYLISVPSYQRGNLHAGYLPRDVVYLIDIIVVHIIKGKYLFRKTDDRHPAAEKLFDMLIGILFEGKLTFGFTFEYAAVYFGEIYSGL